MAKTPRLFGLVALAAVTALLGAACSSASSSGSQQGVKQGGILRIGTLEGIDSLNPFVGFNQDAYSTWFYVYPSLVQYDLHTYKFTHYYKKEMPRRFHAEMDVRRFGPGERLVFEPYTQEVYQEARNWIASHGIFPDGNLGGERYEEATVSVMG